MQCTKLDTYLSILNDSTEEDLREEHRLLWQDYYNSSLKDSEGIYKARETFWKLRHVQLALKDKRNATESIQTLQR